MSKTKILLLETRPHFLLLTPVCVFLGIAAAFYHGYFNPLHAILVLVGSIFAHASVNVFNDYYDYIRGTDLLTKRTPFSGGSGLLPSGALKPKEALILASALLIAGLLIGIYFVTAYPILLPIVALGTFLVYAYTPVLTRAIITEVFPGLGFGLMVIGSYITMLPFRSSIEHITPVAAAVVAGILISNLLFLNEFPDYEADYKTGRKHMVIILGRKKASKVYVMLVTSAYAWIVLAILVGFLPLTSLLSLITIPVAIKACKGCLRYYNKTENLIPSLAKNALITLLTPTFLGVGLVLGKFLA